MLFAFPICRAIERESGRLRIFGEEVVDLFDLCIFEKRNSAALTISSIWVVLRVPTMAAVTAGLCSVQATATTPAVIPCGKPISVSSSRDFQVAFKACTFEFIIVFAPVVLRHMSIRSLGHCA